MSEDRALWDVGFWESFVPPKTTHQSKKIARFGSGSRAFTRLKDTERLTMARELYLAMFAKHRPSEPFEGPVELELLIVWPYRNGEPKAKTIAKLFRMMDKKPDASNMAKTIEDILVELRFINDDGQVSDLIVRKRWGHEPGIGVRITEVHTWQESEQ